MTRRQPVARSLNTFYYIKLHVFVITNVSSKCVRSMNIGSGHHTKYNKHVQGSESEIISHLATKVTHSLPKTNIF